MKKVLLRMVSEVLAVIFIITTPGYSLAPVPGAWNGRVMADFAGKYYQNFIRVAATDEESELLRHNNAPCVILSTYGTQNYLVSKNLADDPVSLYREIVKTEMSVIMQILEKGTLSRDGIPTQETHTAQYEAIKKEVLAVCPFTAENIDRYTPAAKESGISEDRFVCLVAGEAFARWIIRKEAFGGAADVPGEWSALVGLIDTSAADWMNAGFLDRFSGPSGRAEFISAAIFMGQRFYDIIEYRKAGEAPKTLLDLMRDGYFKKREQEKNRKKYGDTKRPGYLSFSGFGYTDRVVASDLNGRDSFTADDMRAAGIVSGIGEVPGEGQLDDLVIERLGQGRYRVLPHTSIWEIYRLVDLKHPTQDTDAKNWSEGTQFNGKTTYVKTIEPEETQLHLYEAFKRITVSGLADAFELVGMLYAMRNYFISPHEKGKNMTGDVVDDVLVRAMPDIASALSDAKDFMDAMFLEWKLWRAVSTYETLYHINVYCLDYGQDVSFDHTAWVMKRPVFSLYKDAFSSPEDLRLFVRTVAEALREDPALAETLKDEDALIAFMSEKIRDIQKKGPDVVKEKKCLILNGDQMLWEYDPSSSTGVCVTEAHKAFHQKIASLSEQGVSLVLVTSATVEAIEKILADIEGETILRREHFGMILGSSGEGAGSGKVAPLIGDIEERLKLVKESFVVFTVDPGEREAFASQYPAILAPVLPADLSQLPGFLDGLNAFRKGGITPEDKLRSGFNAIREAMDRASRSLTPDEFRRSQEIKIDVREARQEDIARVSELTKRTNSYTLTGRRYEETDVAAMLNDREDHRIYLLRTEVKDGYLGRTGVLHLERVSGNTWMIRDFCMSCRVTGQELEIDRGFVALVLKDLAGRPEIEEVRAEYIAAARNNGTRLKYRDLGFTQVSADVTRTEFILDPDKRPGVPDWISVETSDRLSAKDEEDASSPAAAPDEKKGHPAYAFRHMPVSEVGKTFTYKQYRDATNVSRATAWRDFEVLNELGVVSIERGESSLPSRIGSQIPGIFREPVADILDQYQDKRDIPAVKSKLDQELYDTELVAQLIFDNIKAELKENRTYVIKYDASRLSPLQQSVIEAYKDHMNALPGMARVETKKCARSGGSKESLINVYCLDGTGQEIGAGHIDIDIPGKYSAGQYALKIAGMVNIALASSNIPYSGATKERHGHLIGFVRSQFRAITGKDLSLPDSFEDSVRFIRDNIILDLPDICRIPLTELETYYDQARQALIAA